MARHIQILSLFSRLGGWSPIPVASVKGYRFASRDSSRAWTNHLRNDKISNKASGYRDEVSDEELDLEDVEDKLEAVDKDETKRRKTVKYHILRRKMTPSGAPQRQLNWDAIEQIRYLKQEQPDEWTVQRLAEGFSVTPDAVLRVLRSKFVPTPKRKTRQDAKVMTAPSQQMLPSGVDTHQSRSKLPGNHTPAALPTGSRECVKLPVFEQTLMLQGDRSGSLANAPAPVTVVRTELRDGLIKNIPVTRSTEEDRTNHINSTDTKEDEESWDGRLLSDTELEEFIELEKPSPVVRVGKDFFDGDGKFIYRI